MRFNKNLEMLFYISWVIFLVTIFVMGIAKHVNHSKDDGYIVEHTLVEPQEFATVIADMSVVKVSVNAAQWGSAVYIGNFKFLTAAHVVKTNWEKDKSTTLKWGKQEVTSEIIWYNDIYDLALLQVDSSLQENKRFVWSLVAQDMSCERPKLGEELELVGNPFFGDEVHSYGRVAKEEFSLLKDYNIWKDATLVSGPIAPGMSGGGVFNKEGKLVGINVGRINEPNPVFTIPTGFSIIVPTSVYCGLR